MKSKMKGVLGIGFALVLVASLMLFAIPVAAGPYEDLTPKLPNGWEGFSPQEGALGYWYYSHDITTVGPLAKAINGDIYAYVANATSPTGAATPLNPGANDIFKSTDGGRTWTVSAVPQYYAYSATAGGGAVVDMVCSSMSEDVLYLTDGNYVWKSINGGVSFTLVAQSDLEYQLMGACGTPITGFPITSIDVGYDGAGKPIVLIGTRYVSGHLDPDSKPAVGSVYYIADETFSATWTNLQLGCYDCCEWADTPSTAAGCYDVYSVAAAPGFDSVSKVYAVISAPLSGITFPTGYSPYATTFPTVEIRAGDYGASFDYDSATAGVATLTGTIYSATGVPGTAFDMSNTTGTITLAANETLHIVFDPPTTGGTVGISNINGTISWRATPEGSATFCGGTRVVSTLGTVCAWSPTLPTVIELRWNCLWSFEIQHASRIMFPSYYSSESTLFVGVAAVEDTAGTLQGWGEGGDVYRATDTILEKDCIDLNVQGFTTGCTGFNHANICSLHIDDNDALAAGAWDEYQLQSPTRVYYSADGGWTWTPSIKDPTGANQTYVLFGSSIVAATNGCDCAFSLSCGANPGAYFNQISLISMSIDQVLDMTHAPGYVLDSSIMYVLTWDDDACDSVDINSLLRWDGTYWERVHSSRYYVVASTQSASAFWYTPLYEWVEVSPDFNSTDCLYLANSSFYMARSIDAGCSWAPLTYPCYDRPSISAWIVVDEDTVLAAGAAANAGYVWRTTNHGAQPWKSYMVQNTVGGFAGNGVDFDLSLPRAADSDVLLGDASGQVFLSQDLGETWVEIYDTLTGTFDQNSSTDHLTYVVFDPGYGTDGDSGETMFYAAAGSLIGRCDYNASALPFKQDWVYICPAAATCETCSLYMASGIDAAGDTALYVADAGAAGGGSVTSTVSGTIAVKYICDESSPYSDTCTCDITIDAETLTVISGTIADGEPLAILNYNLFCASGAYAGAMDGDITVVGLINGGIGTIVIDPPITLADCVICYPPMSIFEVISSNLTADITSTVTSAHPTGVWRTLNPMDLMPPKYPALVEWEFLNLGAPHVLRHPEADTFTHSVYPDDLWLTTASNMLWALDATSSPTSYLNYIWMWEDPLAAQVIQVSPADGALLATETFATLEWDDLDAATMYEVKVYEECPECLNPLEMKLFGTYYTTVAGETCIKITGLTAGTKYFWKVRVACDSPQVSKWSDLHSFDTALSTTIRCSPECGAEDITLTPNFSWSKVTGATGYEVEVATDEEFTNIVASGETSIEAWDCTAELDYSTTYYWRVRAVKDGVYSGWTYCLFSTMDEPEPTPEPVEPVVIEETEITPTWIWVIIGIGGALTIAVIILIVTTRRVP
jgi:hypothetical protein